MRKNIFTIIFTLTIYLSQGQYASAMPVFDPIQFATQIPQYAQDLISAGAELGSLAQNTLLTLWETIQVPLQNSLITMAQQQMAGNIINWGSGGFQGNSLVVSDPLKYIQNMGTAGLKVNIGNIPTNSIFGDSIFNTIVGNYRSSDPVAKLKSLSQSSLPSIIQSNACGDEKLSSLAYDDVKDENNNYDEATYNARKKELYDSLCKGNPTTDVALAKKLVAVNNQNSSIGGDDAWLALTGGDNAYTKGVRAVITGDEITATKKEVAKLDLQGISPVSDKKCTKQAPVDDGYDDADGGYADETPACAESETVTPGGVVEKSLSSAIQAPLDRLTNLTASGGLSSLLTGFLTSYLAKGINSTLSNLNKKTNSSVTLNYRGPTSAPTVTGPATVSGPITISAPPAIRGAVQDLANDPVKKASIIDPINKQLSSHLNSLNELQTTDNSYMSEITGYKIQLDGIKGCNDYLLANYPEAQGNSTLTTGINYYNNKKGAVDTVYKKISSELNNITSLRNFIATNISDISKSNSTEEIINMFNYYQNQVDSKGLPTITTSAQRQGELQTYKFSVQQDTGGIPGSSGNIPYYKAQCDQLRTQLDAERNQQRAPRDSGE